MPLKVAIIGGGIAGPALAFYLARAGHAVTIIERTPQLRASGAQIDLRAQGIQVVRRMGLLETIRAALVDEIGAAVVDDDARIWATFLANTSGKGAQTGTSEYEIMRGDLVRILYDATKELVTYRFGTSVESWSETAAGVTLRLLDGSEDTFDLLVGADGQGSRTRRALLTAEQEAAALSHTGVHMAYYFVPRAPTDNNLRKVYTMPRSRTIMTRTHNATETQAYLCLYDMSEEVRAVPKASREQQMEYYTKRFAGGRWQTQRFLDGMQATDNWYCQEIVQIKSPVWSRGRVVLLGDAAHCPSPITGMGTTSAFVGAYVLAGELAKSEGDVPRALQAYEATLRPFVDEIQKINPRLVGLLYPQSSWGVQLMRWVSWAMSVCKFPEIMARFSSEERGGWSLPTYPGMGEGEIPKTGAA